MIVNSDDEDEDEEEDDDVSKSRGLLSDEDQGGHVSSFRLDQR